MVAMLGDLASAGHSDAVTPDTADWKIAREVFGAIEEDWLFFQQEVICAIDDPAHALYREMLVDRNT